MTVAGEMAFVSGDNSVHCGGRQPPAGAAGSCCENVCHPIPGKPWCARTVPYTPGMHSRVKLLAHVGCGEQLKEAGVGIVALACGFIYAISGMHINYQVYFLILPPLWVWEFCI